MDGQNWLTASTAWYDTHAARFAQDADACNPGLDRQAFLDALPPTGPILDVGCGSGRDLAAFAAAGRDGEGWEPAPNLAAIARTKTTLPVRERSLDDLPGSGPWAGIWALGVLLHTPTSDWTRHLRAMAEALAPGGVACVIVKDGLTNGVDARGRPFGALDFDGLNAICPKMDHVAWRITTAHATESSGKVVAWHTVWGQRLS